MPGLHITDLIPLEELQRVQDQFAMATGLAAILVDYRGKPITSQSGFTDFCALMRTNPQRREGCFASDAHAGLQGAIRRQSHVYICHAGLVDLSIPLLVGDEYLGAMMCGQVRLPMDDPHSLPTMAVLGPSDLDPELRALRDKVPVMSMARIKAATQTLDALMGNLVRSAWLARQTPARPTEAIPGEAPRIPEAQTTAVAFPTAAAAQETHDEVPEHLQLDLVAVRRCMNDEDLPGAVALVRQFLDLLFQSAGSTRHQRIGRGAVQAAGDALWNLAREIDDTAGAEVSRRINQERVRPRAHLSRYEAEEYLLGLLFCIHTTVEHTRANQPRTVQSLINRIECRPTDFLTLQQAADYLSVSPHHLSRLFKAETGATFIDYVNARRITQAKFLLRHTDLPVLRIAADLRFKPANYFSRSFKAATGLTPSDYRRNASPPGTSGPIKDSA